MTSQSIHSIPVTTENLPELTFRLDARVPAGSLLRLRADSLRALSAVEVVDVSADTGDSLDFRVVHRHSDSDMRERWCWMCNTRSLIAWETGAELPSGTLLKVVLRIREANREEGGNCPALPELKSFSGAALLFQLGTAPDVESPHFSPVSNVAGYNMEPGPAAGMVVSRKTSGKLLLTYVDECFNPTPIDGRTVTVTDQAGEITQSVKPNSTTLTVDTRGRLARDRVWHVRDDHGLERRVHDNPVGLDGTPVWFGEFHWHCEFSGDGNRAMEESLTSARDELGLDFCGPSDHIDCVNAIYKDEACSVARQTEICRDFDDSGRFVTLPGAEVSGRFGHINIYSRSWDEFSDVWKKCGPKIVEQLAGHPYQSAIVEIADIMPDGNLLIPHHTNTDSYTSDRIVAEDGLPFWMPLQWPLPSGGRALRLAEMNQTRGVSESETAEPEWGNPGNGLGGSLRTALTRGYRIGFCGGTDNHNGWPTRSHNGPICGLTAVLAPSLETESVFDALHTRRCYATTGARIVADATCNGYPIGSEQKLKPGAPREFRVRVRGTAPLAAVQLIHNNTVLADWPVEDDRHDLDLTWRDERPGRSLHGAWYYVRIRQTDGHCAWLSPWWIDLEPA